MKHLLPLLAFLLVCCKAKTWQECIDSSNGSDAECYECDMKYITLDLPEEYPLATENDTLIAIKKGNTLFVQFNNK